MKNNKNNSETYNLLNFILDSTRVNGTSISYLVNHPMALSFFIVEIIFVLIGALLGFIFGNTTNGILIGLIVSFPIGLCVGLKVKKEVRKKGK